MKKKVFILLTIFLSAFFFCGINFVSADTLTINHYYDYFDTLTPIFINNEEYLLSTPTYTPLRYTWYNTGSIPTIRYFKLSNSSCEYQYSSNNKAFWLYCTSSNGISSYDVFNSSTLTFSNTSTGTRYYYFPLIGANRINDNGFVYSDTPILYQKATSNYDTIVIPSFTSSTYQVTIPEITIHENEPIPSYRDIYYTYISFTPDDTPLLTSFYSLCIDKIGVVAEEFMTNYIYLAIITIFLFITILLIIKRRLF